MYSLPLSKSEIVAELLEIQAEREKIADAVKRLDDRQMELLIRLQSPKKATKKHIPLTFGKNVITWDGGALAIKGKGYRFIKALFEADKMRLKREILGGIVWNNDLVRQNTFIVFLHWLAGKLEKAKFPYRLLPAKSKEKIKTVEHKAGEKPVKKRFQSEIIGAKLGIR